MREEKTMGQIVLKTLTNITKYPDYVLELKKLLGIDLSSKTTLPMSSTVQHPLNQILYGVPGTGKTYATVNYAVAIIENVSTTKINQESETVDGRKAVVDRYNSYKEQ
jgi:replication-associated recombination protein RarA